MKGMAPTADSSLTKFGVFAAYIPEGSDPDKLNLGYMINIPYEKKSEGWFDTEPARYWPVAGTMTFFALTPYDEHILDGVDMQAIEQSRYPTIEWTPNDDPKRQVDICVAVNKNQPRQLEVPMEFHHATSQIYFAANYVDLEQYQFIVIDTIQFTNIIGTKNVTISAEPPYVTWQSDFGLPRTKGYTLTRKGGHLDSIPLPLSTTEPRGVQISTNDGRLYLIPQTYTASSSDVELRVAYTLYYENTDEHKPVEVVNQFVMETVMPHSEWKPDMRYRYVLTIHDVTQEIQPVTVAMYEDKKAVYYPMVCSFLLGSETRVQGTDDALTVQVGPIEVTPTNQEVDWTANGVSMQDMYNNTPSAAALPIRLEFRSTPTGTAIDPSTVFQQNTHTVYVVCKELTVPGEPVKIKARTRWAATEDSHKEANMEMNVIAKGASFAPYPTDDYGW